MKLECSEGILSANATEADIRKVFADNQGRGEFIILSESDQVYIQAAGEEDGPHILEYRDVDSSRHFQCSRTVSTTEVASAFLKYLRRDATWKSDFQWNREQNKPWWRFW